MPAQSESAPSPLWPLLKGKQLSPGSQKSWRNSVASSENGSGHRGLSICHDALALVKPVQVCDSSSLSALRPGWLTRLFHGCQARGDGSFLKTHNPFQVEFSFCSSFVCANISGLIEYPSLFQTRHMLAFPAQYGHLGI